MSYNPYSKPLNERDTHFQGFAKLLMRDVDEKNAVKGLSTGRYLDEEELCLIIAQHAYDLMDHIISHTPAGVSDADDWNIPDLTEWPEREEEPSDPVIREMKRIGKQYPRG